MRAAAEQDNLRILLPLVTAAEQVREVRRLIGVEKDRLAALGLASRADFPLGVMVEVPAAAAAAGELAREADFFSIGTNDLIQYALAVDRGNESVAQLYDPLHPGVLRLIAMVVEEGRSAGIDVAVCGEMASDRSSIGALLRLGIRELSVQPRAVGAVREVVRRWTIEAEPESSERSRAASSASEVEGDPTPTI
jgi:phosphotransferase system enzyme I (PtsI)